MRRIGLMVMLVLLGVAPAMAGSDVGPRYTAQECCEYAPCPTPPCAACPECAPAPAPAPEYRFQRSHYVPSGDSYDELQAHPLRILAYVVHPVGFAAEWLLTRPFHKLVSQPDLEPVFGHGRHDFYGDAPVHAELSAPRGDTGY